MNTTIKLGEGSDGLGRRAEGSITPGDPMFNVQYDERTGERIGERFIKAWSVLGGRVRECDEPTIPAEHW